MPDRPLPDRPMSGRPGAGVRLEEHAFRPFLTSIRLRGLMEAKADAIIDRAVANAPTRDSGARPWNSIRDSFTRTTVVTPGGWRTVIVIDPLRKSAHHHALMWELGTVNNPPTRFISNALRAETTGPGS